MGIERLIHLTSQLKDGSVELQREIYDQLIVCLLEYPHRWVRNSEGSDIRLSIEYRDHRLHIHPGFLNIVDLRLWARSPQDIINGCITLKKGKVFSKQDIHKLKSIIRNVNDYCKCSGDKDVLVGTIEFLDHCCGGESLSTLDFEIGELLTHENHIVRKVAKLIQEKCRENYEDIV